jgi:hypothetical protein|tara:strand:- start:6599 stop:6781 length:183 start_codon:yes stop_codon:yes gene_type:complete
MKKGKKIKPIKKKKHDKIVNDFENAKKNHLERLATKMLKKDEMFLKLKEKKINNNFLDLF